MTSGKWLVTRLSIELRARTLSHRARRVAESAEKAQFFSQVFTRIRSPANASKRFLSVPVVQCASRGVAWGEDFFSGAEQGDFGEGPRAAQCSICLLAEKVSYPTRRANSAGAKCNPPLIVIAEPGGFPTRTLRGLDHRASVARD